MAAARPFYQDHYSYNPQQTMEQRSTTEYSTVVEDELAGDMQGLVLDREADVEPTYDKDGSQGFDEGVSRSSGILAEAVDFGNESVGLREEERFQELGQPLPTRSGWSGDSGLFSNEAEGTILQEKERSPKPEQHVSSTLPNRPETGARVLKNTPISAVSKRAKRRQNLVLQDFIACQNDPNHVSTLDAGRKGRLGVEFSRRKRERDREFHAHTNMEGCSRNRPCSTQALQQAEDDILLCKISKDMSCIGRRRAIRLLALLDKEKEAKGQLGETEKIRVGLEQYIITQAMRYNKPTSNPISGNPQDYQKMSICQDSAQQVKEDPRKLRKAKKLARRKEAARLPRMEGLLPRRDTV